MRMLTSMLLIVGIIMVRNTIADTPPAAASAPVATSNIAHCQGVCSFTAPDGWTIKSRPGSATACDMKGEHDCVAMISLAAIYRPGTLDKYAQFRFEWEKKAHPGSTVEQDKLQSFTTDSGWEGFKGVQTVTTGDKSDREAFYFFLGHDNTKVEVQTSCHGDAANYYTPLFEAAIKTLKQE